jgi:phosphatidylinositol-bisphosphatase
MKKISNALKLAAGGYKQGGGDGENNEDGEGSGDSLEDALSILRDHRELSSLSPPICLPSSVVDPLTFPYFEPAGSNWLDDSPYISALQAEVLKATVYIKDDWIRKQMKAKEAFFTTQHEIKVWLGTYNVNGKKPEFPIDPFICAGEKKRNEKSCYDIAVIGLQEMVDLNVQNAVYDSATKERAAQWLELIQRSLDDLARRNGEGDGYILLAQKSLVGLMICAFVLKKHRKSVSSVQATSAATGIMNVVGNKGGCSIRFNFCDTSFCFVCAHLAAHTDGVDARNGDVRSINQKTSFKLDPPPPSQVDEKYHSRIAATTPEALVRGELQIKEHDYVVWLGDFNYRMDASNSPEEVFDRVNSKDFLWLHENDQLATEMRSNRVFQGFTEVRVKEFLPTYKFEPGTDNYDRRPEKKVRAPAWTDRIVWRYPSSVEKQVRCVVYDRVDGMRASDHKPVEAGLAAIVRVVNDTFHQLGREGEDLV